MPIYQLKLIDREPIARETIVCRFEKPAGFTFKPGQYGGFTLTHSSTLEITQATRRFSLLSAPHDPFVAIATRLQDSPYKKALQTLSPGEAIKFAGPIGNFVLDEDETTPIVFIAGGIGITPFYSMIRDAIHRGSKRSFTLFYGNESLRDATYLTELQALSTHHSTFQCIATLSKPDANWSGETGWISYALIKKYIEHIEPPYYYVCGSPAMVKALHETLRELGIHEERIKVEDFPGY